MGNSKRFRIAEWVAPLILLCLCLGAGAFAIWYLSPVEEAKRDVKSVLKDPSSAIFTHIEACKDDDGSLLFITGLVNSKNEYGGYDGGKNFLVPFNGSSGIPSFNRLDFSFPQLSYFYEMEYSESVDLRHDGRTCAQIFRNAQKKHATAQDESFERSGL